MPKASAASAQAVAAQMERMGVREIDSWGEWSAGDRCGIVGTAGEFRIIGFRDDGSSVSVVGGPVLGQKRTWECRSFAPEKLTTKILKRATNASVESDEESEEE